MALRLEQFSDKFVEDCEKNELNMSGYSLSR